MKIQIDVGPVEMDLRMRLRDAARERSLAKQLSAKDKQWNLFLGLVTSAAAATIPFAMKWFQPEEDPIDLSPSSGSQSQRPQENCCCGEMIEGPGAHPKCNAAYRRGAGDAAKAHQQDGGKEDGGEG